MDQSNNKINNYINFYFYNMTVNFLFIHGNF